MRLSGRSCTSPNHPNLSPNRAVAKPSLLSTPPGDGDRYPCDPAGGRRQAVVVTSVSTHAVSMEWSCCQPGGHVIHFVGDALTLANLVKPLVKPPAEGHITGRRRRAVITASPPDSEHVSSLRLCRPAMPSCLSRSLRRCRCSPDHARRRCLLLHVFSIAVAAGAASFISPGAAVKPMAKPGEEHAICSNYYKNLCCTCACMLLCTMTSKPTKWLIAKLYSFGHEDVYRYTLISQVQV
uniref:Uncharacterized protein n=1 Tax=Oryza meridionalis TaxID=40149 RepID=A0A0E0EVN6_9ORYZ